MAYIYKITNRVNGKVYIGQTTRTVQIRWNQHKNRSKKDEYKEHLYRAIRKYGLENFSIEELEQCDDEIRFERETEYIIQYNSQEPNGYNYVLSQCGACPAYINVILSDWESGLTINQIGRLRHLNPKTVSQQLQGHGVTKEEIMKRRVDLTRKNCSKAVNQYDLQGSFIRQWPSASSLKEQKMFPGPIGKACNGDLLTAYNYIWQYDIDDNVEEVVAELKKHNKTGRNKKKILQIDEQGNIIAEYESASAAGRAFGQAHSAFAYAARTGGTAYGYYWRYKD